MACYLGIDTSNYTTSAALYDAAQGRIVPQKKLLEVKPGEKGLRQSEAVFQHTRQLPQIIEQLFSESTYRLQGIGVSAFPRRQQGSYMPCFLVGEGTARSLAALSQLPVYSFSHQEGHIAAALYSCNRLDLLKQGEFIAFHFSGGTTECVHCTAQCGQLNVQLFAHTADLNTGQAIDRVGVMLGMKFPCGAELERLAAQSQKTYKVHPSFSGENPSVSGLENKAARMLSDGAAPADIAKFTLDYVLAVVDHISASARRQFGAIPFIYAGGVMSNRYIAKAIGQKYGGLFAAPEFSTDNAAGIAVLAAVMGGAL